MTDREDFEFLAANAAEARALGVANFTHLDQPIGQWNYIRIANLVRAGMESNFRSNSTPCALLDWGCGFGQMTYLLRRRGFNVTSYEVGEADPRIPPMPLTRELSVVRSTHPTALPFPDASFDAVLGCGVLEHVDEFSQKGNELESLREIRRVLRPGGTFFIFQLPQEHSWQEALIRHLKAGYCHPRRYTEHEIRTMLAREGFEVTLVRRMNLLPKNLTTMPGPVRQLYSRFAQGLIRVDQLFCAIPVLNRIAGVLELTTRVR